MEIDENRRRGEEEYKGWEQQYRDLQKKERIRGSRYNRWYKVKREGDTCLFKEGVGESRWRMVIRFRMNNEMRGARYWETEERRIYRGR